MWGEKEVRRAATNKELKGGGYGTPPCCASFHYPAHERSRHNTSGGNEAVSHLMTPQQAKYEKVSFSNKWRIRSLMTKIAHTFQTNYIKKMFLEE